MDYKGAVRVVGQRIRALRLRRGLTLQKAADGYGVVLRVWQKFEQGRNVELLTLLRLAAFLRTTPETLVRGLHKARRMAGRG